MVSSSTIVNNACLAFCASGPSAGPGTPVTRRIAFNWSRVAGAGYGEKLALGNRPFWSLGGIVVTLWQGAPQRLVGLSKDRYLSIIIRSMTRDRGAITRVGVLCRDVVVADVCVVITRVPMVLSSI